MSKEKDVINIIGVEHISKIVNDIIELREAQESLLHKVNQIKDKQNGHHYSIVLSMEEVLTVDHLTNAVLDAEAQEKQLIRKLIKTCCLFTEQNKSSNQTDASNYSFETGV
jgi:hypothetical protein